MNIKSILLSTAFIVLLVASVIGNTQKSQQEGALTITGHSGQAPLLHINGRWYVDMESLARLTQGTLSFKANQIILTLPGSPVESPAAVPQARQGFSKEFLQAEIEEMGVIREWRIAILSAVQNNSPISEEWLSAHQRLASKNLAYVSAALTTDDDRSGFPLLTTELGNMQKLSDRYLAIRKQAAFISLGSLDSDSLNQQIINCAHGLAAMTANHSFQDEPACH